MKRLYIYLLLHFLFHCSLSAQEQAAGPLSLEKAIETALTNNIALRQSQLAVKGAKVEQQQAIFNLLPRAEAAVTHGLNQGRSIDPFTNSYVDQEIMYGSYGAGASLLLFNGLRQQYSIRQTRQSHEAAELELAQAGENLRLSIMIDYLQVLNNEELVEVAQNQVQVTRQQLERLERLHQQGAVSPPQLAELRGQLKAEELALLNARQAVESAKLLLAQRMNVPYSQSMQLEPVALETILTEEAAVATEAVYGRAVGQLALVQAAQLRRQSAEAGLRAMRGTYYPSLFLNGNLNSNYSSVASLNGERIQYNDQLRNNVFSTISLSLRIPILNGFQAHNQVKVAKLALAEAGLAEEETRAQLRRQVEEAQLNLYNARERYQVLQEQEQAFAEAFRAAEIRFNAGAGTPVDYLLAKNNLDRSRTNLIMAKYDYVFRLKILDFYIGR